MKYLVRAKPISVVIWKGESWISLIPTFFKVAWHMQSLSTKPQNIYHYIVGKVCITQNALIYLQILLILSVADYYFSDFYNSSNILWNHTEYVAKAQWLNLNTF